MKLEKQVVSLGLSKKLKKLGYPQKGYFVWYPYSEGALPKELEDPTKKGYFVQSTFDSNYDPMWWPKEKAITAPTVVELGEWLWKKYGLFELMPQSKGYLVSIRLNYTDKYFIRGTMADCLASALAWLVEMKFASF